MVASPDAQLLAKVHKSPVILPSVQSLATLPQYLIKVQGLVWVRKTWADDDTSKEQMMVYFMIGLIAIGEFPIYKNTLEQSRRMKNALEQA